MANYYRVAAGRRSEHALACVEGGFVGADFLIHQDLSADLVDDWGAFNQKYAPMCLENHPDRSKISVGLACGAIWTFSRVVAEGDVILCLDRNGAYRVGEVSGGYRYEAGGVLPHRRAVTWRERTIPQSSMSQALQNSVGFYGTISNLTPHSEEIARLILAVNDSGEKQTGTVSFVLERQLQDFLVANWDKTSLGSSYDIYQDNGELVGSEYPTSVGRIDILAVSKDGERLLVVELKRGRASDEVVGQVLRYMGYVQGSLAESGQVVEGAIIALEDDEKLRMALIPVPAVTFYRYEVTFTLTPA